MPGFDDCEFNHSVDGLRKQFSPTHLAHKLLVCGSLRRSFLGGTSDVRRCRTRQANIALFLPTRKFNLVRGNLRSALTAKYIATTGPQPLAMVPRDHAGGGLPRFVGWAMCNRKIVGSGAGNHSKSPNAHLACSNFYPPQYSTPL